MISDWEVAVRLILSAVLAGVIGYERQARHKAAGLRTHILVAVGSCLIMVLSVNLYHSVQGLTNADPARLAAQVVSGIGFLGAGSILKEGSTVKGLTTAASLWVVSGVGLATGFGYYTGALLTTLLVFITLTILSRMEHKEPESCRVNLCVTSVNIPGQMGRISSVLGREDARICDIRMDENDESLAVISLCVDLPHHADLSAITERILSIDGVKDVRRES